MNKLLFLLLAGCFFMAFPATAQEGAAPVVADTTYRRVIREGRDSLACHLAYPLGSYGVLRDFGSNDAELARLEGFMRRAFSDTLIYVHSVQLTGYSSIDGTYAVNRRLSLNRVNGMRQYLDKEYALSSRYRVHVSSVPEDWATLRRLVATSAYPWKETVVDIIDRTNVFEGRESKLMLLEGGVPYRKMQEELFPLLRRVEIKVKYDLKQINTCRYNLPSVDPPCVRLKERKARESGGVRRERMKFVPLIGVKTNLVSWAGVTPEFERTTFMPNLAVEGFFARRFSAELSAVYSDFDFNGGEHWGLSGYGLEPRFWLKGDGRYKGLYFGVYTQSGDFNVNREEAGKSSNHTGTYFDAGVSVGYYLSLTGHWGFEFGLHGGYHKADSELYEVRGGTSYRREKEDADRLGLTRLNVSVGYRF